MMSQKLKFKKSLFSLSQFFPLLAIFTLMALFMVAIST